MRKTLIAIVVLTACIHVPPRPIDPRVSGEALASRSVSDPAFQQFLRDHGGTPGKWNLNTLTLAAFYFHPELDLARARAAVARAARITAAARPNPTFSATIEHKDDPTMTPWVTSFGFDVPIEMRGKRGLRVRQAEDLVRAADFAIAQRAWELRSNLRTQLATINSATSALDVLRRQQQVQTEIVDMLDKRVSLGEAGRPELTTARIALRQTALLIRDRERDVAQARARLAAAAGLTLRALEGIDVDTALGASPSAQSVDAIRETALTTRPDILAALADYSAAESRLRLELARQYPDLHFTPGFGWDQGMRTWTFGVSSELPVFSRNQGPIAEAVARRTEAQASVEALQAQVIAGVDEASVRYREATRKLADAEEVIRLQTRQVEAATNALQKGEGDRLALRSAELELESAQLARAEALAQVQEAIGALEDAVEQPLSGAAIARVPTENPRL